MAAVELVIRDEKGIVIAGLSNKKGKIVLMMLKR